MSTKKRKKSVRKLKKVYINYMHNKLLDLYIRYLDNPLDYFKEKRELKSKELHRIVTITPNDFLLLIYQISRMIKLVNDLVELIKEANEMILHKRFLREDEDWIIRGIIDWTKTLNNLIYGKPPSQKIIWYTLNSPENLLLKITIEHFYKQLNSLKDKLSQMEDEFHRKMASLSSNKKKKPSFPGLYSIQEAIKESLEKLKCSIDESFLKFIPSEIILNPKLDIYSIVDEIHYIPWKPSWVEKLLNIVEQYVLNRKIDEEIKKVLDAIMTMLENNPNLQEVNTVFKMYAFKLYELYVLYILIKAFEKLGARITPRNGIIHARIKNKDLKILFNQPINTVSEITPIPDITIENREKRIVIEVKFTISPSYLSRSVFKTISYLMLCRSNIGILVYPHRPLKQPIKIEKEDKEIYKLITSADEINRKTIMIDDKNIMYILEIEPIKNKEERNIQLMKEVIEDIIRLTQQSKTN